MALGKTLAGSTSHTALRLEREARITVPYAAVDQVTAQVVIDALSGARVVVVEQRGNHAELRLPTLDRKQHDAIAEAFEFATQQQRGAWFLPEEATVRTGTANLPWHFAKYPRFASSVVRDEKVALSLSRSSNAVYYWAVLDTLFADLFAPLDLRGPVPPKGDAAEKRAAWLAVDETYAALDIDVAAQLASLRYGSGWSRLGSIEQLVAKQAFLARMRGALGPDIGALRRMSEVRPLLDRYYAKAKKSPPLMRQVLTKPYHRTLSAFFGGDWRAFVEYLGEQPRDEERIARPLAESNIVAGASSDATGRVAEDGAEPPIEVRVGLLRRFWVEVDAAHARQASGMRSLWGLLADFESAEFEHSDDATDDNAVYDKDLHRKIIDGATLGEADRLWNGVFLPSYPDAIVSAIDPYARMCDVFGPALRFWNSLGLTAWFIAEGPSSRTDMRRAEKYYERDLNELDEVGCPVDRSMFLELIESERALGPEQFDDSEDDSVEVPGGVITFRVTSGSGRRSGFERIRDVVTRHRRAWAEKYLDQYLRSLWETQIGRAAREFNKLFESKQKAPTLKQFAKHAEVATNNWFGGDVSQLYRVLGKACPVETVRRRYLVESPAQFAGNVFRALGGTRTSWKTLAGSMKDRPREIADAKWRAHQSLVKLAGMSLKYVQLREALGRTPTLKEFGPSSFYYLAPALDESLVEKWAGSGGAGVPLSRAEMNGRVGDVDAAWGLFSSSVERCLGAT